QNQRRSGLAEVRHAAAAYDLSGQTSVVGRACARCARCSVAGEQSHARVQSRCSAPHYAHAPGRQAAQAKASSTAQMKRGQRDGTIAGRSSSPRSPPRAIVMSTTDKPTNEQAAKVAPPGKSWRDLIKIHPEANKFPLLDQHKLIALGNDIKAT